MKPQPSTRYFGKMLTKKYGFLMLKTRNNLIIFSREKHFCLGKKVK